jgi:hypothetical protein
MPPVQLPRGSYFRDVGKFPRLELRNMMAESTPVSNDGVAFIQRPGLAYFAATSGGAGVRALAPFQDGFIAVYGSGVDLIGSGGDTSPVATVIGGGRARIASGATGALLLIEGNLYWTTGVTWEPVTFPDGARVADIAFVGGFFVALREGTDTIYWSDALTPTVWNPLSFVSAEAADDTGVAIAALSGGLWVFGTTTTQQFYQSGDADAVFRPYEGAVYQRGCIARDTVTVLDNTLFWVGDDLNVYRAADVPEVVSQAWVSERIGQADVGDLSAWAYALDGRAVYVLCLGPLGALAYDVSTQQWSEWYSYSGGWRGAVGAQNGSTVLTGDRTGSLVWKLTPGLPSDHDELVMQRFVTGVMLVGRGTVRVASVKLWTSTGWGPLTGQGSDPEIALYTSEDGHTWANEGTVKSGKTGEYGRIAEWRRLDPARYPHKLMRFQMTDPVPWRVTEATVNDLW